MEFAATWQAQGTGRRGIGIATRAQPCRDPRGFAGTLHPAGQLSSLERSASDPDRASAHSSGGDADSASRRCNFRLLQPISFRGHGELPRSRQRLDWRGGSRVGDRSAGNASPSGYRALFAKHNAKLHGLGSAIPGLPRPGASDTSARRRHPGQSRDPGLLDSPGQRRKEQVQQSRTKALPDAYPRAIPARPLSAPPASCHASSCE